MFWTTVLASMLGTTGLALADPPHEAAIEVDKRYYEAERKHAKERREAAKHREEMYMSR